MENKINVVCLALSALLYCFSFSSSAQAQRKILSTSTISLGQVPVLEGRNLAQYRGLTLSPSGNLIAAFSSSTILVFDRKANSIVEELERPGLLGLGFINDETLVAVTKATNDSLLLYNFKQDRTIHSMKLPSRNMPKVRQYQIAADSMHYYVSSMTEAVCWKFNKLNNQIEEQEVRVIYSDYAGEILKHLYRTNEDASYAIQRLENGNTVNHKNLSPSVIPACYSFSQTGSYLVVTDAYSGGSTIPNLFLYNTVKNHVSYRAQTHSNLLFVAFIDDTIFTTVESNSTTLVNSVLVRTTDGKVRASRELSDRRLGNFIISRDRKVMLFQQLPENEIYLIDFTK